MGDGTMNRRCFIIEDDWFVEPLLEWDKSGDGTRLLNNDIHFHFCLLGVDQ